MLSLVSDALTAQSGLTDPTDPRLTVRVMIKDGEDPQVFLTPSDGDNGPFTALIARRLKEDPAPKVPGGYIWKVRQYSEVVTLADDKDAARFLFGLFRRDLAPAFEAMEEMVCSLPSASELQEGLDDLLRRRFARMIRDGAFIDPSELRLSVLCCDCRPYNLRLRTEEMQHELRELAREMEAAFVRIQGNGETIPQAMIDQKQRILEQMEKTINAPPIKENELFLGSTVGHGHPFYDLSVQLMNDAGGTLLRGRALTVARDFLAKTESFSAILRETLAERHGLKT